jgi:hypothetical protein
MFAVLLLIRMRLTTAKSELALTQTNRANLQSAAAPGNGALESLWFWM